MHANDDAPARLADFLRARRAEVSPESVALPRAGRPRRVAGLRREEVAQLASISADYYVRLEQGRVSVPSDAVLEAIARALRLDDDQRRYLYEITGAGGAQPPLEGSPEEAAPQLVLVMERLVGLPAMVLGRCADVLAWNPMAAALLVDFGALAPPERNLVRLIFLDELTRSRFTDVPTLERTAAAMLRMAAARHPDDPRFVALFDELSARSARFGSLWSSHAVTTRSHGPRTYRHPAVGEIELEWEWLTSTSHPAQSIMVLTPAAGSPALSALEALL